MTDNERCTALVEKDPAYDGAFFAAVKTTGIFCRTTCAARKPKRENVSFYDTVHDALSAGYRPCKICRPMESANHIPQEIASLLAEVQADPQFRITEWELKQRGFDPNTLRRWFQKHYGMTFQAFCRMNRINTAFGAIRDGNSVLDAALDSGYASTSGFSSAFDKIIGTAPGKAKKKPANVLIYERFDAPFGPMIAVASETGLNLLEFGDRRMLESEFTGLQKRLDAVLLPGKNEFTQAAIRQIQEYFAGTRRTFDVPLHAPGTEFQQRVWAALREIPYGEIRSYGDIAASICEPKAVRAVGTANGMNRIAIMIPCHRVIGASGALTGYGGGLWRKEWLLKHEQEHK
ncbi:MAG: XRE family transcriptional regulator [Clostridiales bacterium]|nr:XRE family transcriptional regulator [Clostridiales bacterium]